MAELATRPIRGSFLAARRLTMTRRVTHRSSLSRARRVCVLSLACVCDVLSLGQKFGGFSGYGAACGTRGSCGVARRLAGDGHRAR
jgi:hypothetical protein